MESVRLKRLILRALYRVPGMEPLGIARKLHEPVAVVKEALHDLQVDGKIEWVSPSPSVSRFVRQLRRERRADST